MKKSRFGWSLPTKFFIKRWLKCNIKAFVIGGLISLIISVLAVVILNSRQVEYKNGKSVETAVNELYEKYYQSPKYMKDIGCEGCTKLEYLESTGSQYIDTEYIPNSNTSLYLDCEYIGSFSSSTYVFIGGSRTDVNQEALMLPVQRDTNNLRYEYSNSNNFTFTKEITNRSIIQTNKNQIMVGDSTYNVNSSSFTGRYNFYVFDANLTGSPSGRGTKMKLWSMKIYDNDTLVRDYIPVLDNNGRPCLFDKVEKKRYYNQGNGDDFLYG